MFCECEAKRTDRYRINTRSKDESTSAASLQAGFVTSNGIAVSTLHDGARFVRSFESCGKIIFLF